MTLRSTALLTALTALTLSACGDDDPDATAATTEPAPPAARTPDASDSEATDRSGNVGEDAAGEDDAGVAASPKEGGTSGKPGAPDMAEARPAEARAPAGGKPSAEPSPDAGRRAAGPGGAQRHAGTLEAGDETLDSGEYADGYTVEAAEGQTITADLASDDFDGYLILRAPSGEQVDNDDDEDSDGTDARIVHRATEAGTWRVIATSYEPGETGAYRLTVRTGGR